MTRAAPPTAAGHTGASTSPPTSAGYPMSPAPTAYENQQFSQKVWHSVTVVTLVTRLSFEFFLT